MAKRHFPVRPNLEQLKHQAKDLLRAFQRGDAEALEDFREHLTTPVDAESVRLADAQFVLARSYGLPNWPRLVTACRMTDAIWRGDVEDCARDGAEGSAIAGGGCARRGGELGSADVVCGEPGAGRSYRDACEDWVRRTWSMRSAGVPAGKDWDGEETALDDGASEGQRITCCRGRHTR